MNEDALRAASGNCVCGRPWPCPDSHLPALASSRPEPLDLETELLDLLGALREPYDEDRDISLVDTLPESVLDAMEAADTALGRLGNKG